MNNSSKIWTILICCYNCSKTIKAAIESIDYKNNSDIEVLLVDDGSKDNLRGIIQPYLNDYPNIFKYYRKANHNQGSCVNYAISQAKGRFFSLLDSDDTYNIADFNVVIDNLRTLDEDVDLLITNYSLHFIQPDGSDKVAKVRVSKTPRDIRKKSFDNISLFSMLTIHSCIYKTQIIKTICPIPEDIGYSDNVLYFKVLQLVENIAYSNKGVFLYNYFIRRDHQAISMIRSIKNFDDFPIILNTMLNCPIDITNSKRVAIARKIISNHFSWILIILSNYHNYHTGIKVKMIKGFSNSIKECERKNCIKRKLRSPLVKFFAIFPKFSLYFIKFLYRLVPVKMIKATKYSKEAKKEAKALSKEYKAKFKAAKKIIKKTKKG